ncbi:DUF3367 domain-containing protein [Streptosporangiaceae bacterium NEAU-GS5]|nr:DUF3367 domain-containing protein [Streptosporangiaceae bacterium NEAU-GS5]
MTVANWFSQMAARPDTTSPTDSYSQRVRHRLRMVAGCLLLGAIAFNTATDKIISETKLDMAVNPVAFLGRALHLWDSAYFGHLQNQAYGYLFPMGPFYTLWLKLEMPAWNVQRLWMSVVLCAAFVGVVQLARAMRIGTPNSRLLAGLAYALAPHAQALIGINSSEFLPTAVLPWIMLPLVKTHLSPRRAAALSAVAFLFCGGVNAAAELAALAVPLIYLLTRAPGPRRRRLLAWWAGCVAAAAFWWVVPLFIFGKYVFSFLPYIETASATTGVTSLTNVLRGTSSWLAFLQVDGAPWLEVAYQQATQPWLITVSVLLAGLGLYGLVRRGGDGPPERSFLVITLLIGVAVVAAGHASELTAPLSGSTRDLLDGALAPFRNLHKFDGLIRLPLMLGLAAATIKVSRAAVASGLLAATCLPILTQGLASAGSFAAIPDYWTQATRWLDQNAGDGMVLALPGSKRGEYLWGRPLDEPMQPLLTARWATHTIVPWGSAGNARLLAAIDDRFSSGQGSVGLTATLRRYGVKYLVIRNDLDRRTIGAAWPARVHQALADSPGLTLAARFGPGVGMAEYPDASAWLDQPYFALEIYQVADPAPLAGTVDASRPLRVGGAPEAVLNLAEQGLLTDDRPVIVGDDPGALRIPAADTIVTDTLRKRGVAYSDLRQTAGPTLSADDPDPGTDLSDPAWQSFQSTSRLFEIAGVSASSSDAGVDAMPGSRDPGHQPFAALDGDRRTSWRSNGWNGAVGEWLEVRLTQPSAVPYVEASFEQSYLGPQPTEVAITTDARTVRQTVRSTNQPQRLTLPAGRTAKIRITVTKTAGKSVLGNRVGILELTVPQVVPERSIAVPGAPNDPRGDATWSFSREGYVSPCMRGSFAWACSGRLGVLGEDGYGFTRSFVSYAAGEWSLSGQAVLTDKAAIERLTSLPGDPVKVTASSTVLEDAPTMGRSAFDGDAGTIWYASPFDKHPTLNVRLAQPATLSRIKVTFPDSFQGPPPVQVTVRGDHDTRGGWVGRDGWVTFPSMTTSTLAIEFTAPASRAIQVNEITIPGVRKLGALSSFPLLLPCGYGPTLKIDNVPVDTTIDGGTLDDVIKGRPVSYRACEPVHVIAGDARLSARPGDGYRIDTAVLRPRAAAQAATVTMKKAAVESWGDSERKVKVNVAAASYLVVNENYNTGWRAEVGGRALSPVRLDGWRQGYLLPAGTSGIVTLTYAPDRPYQAALGVGALLVLLVLVAAFVPARAPVPVLKAAPRKIRALWLIPVAALYGFWVGGLAGIAVLTVLTAAGAWAAQLGAAEHVRLGPLMRLARWASGPPVALACFALAGVSLATGAYVGGRVLTDLVPQLLCLPLLACLLGAIPEVDRPVRRVVVPADDLIPDRSLSGVR